MAINFSFRNKKKEAVEKYVKTAVLTYKKEEDTKKFYLNKCAIEALGYDLGKVTGNMIAYAREGESNVLLLVNTTGTPTEGEDKIPNQSRITLKNSFSNSKFLEKMETFINGELTDGMEFMLAEMQEELPCLAITQLIDENFSEDESDFDESPTKEEVKEVEEAVNNDIQESIQEDVNSESDSEQYSETFN